MKPERYTFKCWSCGRKYTLLREITEEQTLLVACPYCNQEAVVDLAPFRKKVKPVIKSVMRGEENGQDLGEELDLPDVLPTQQKT